MSANDEENPFGDPAVQNAVSTTARVDLDDYNPFDNKTTAQTAEQSPAVMNPTEEPVPAAKPQISTAEFQEFKVHMNDMMRYYTYYRMLFPNT